MDHLSVEPPLYPAGSVSGRKGKDEPLALGNFIVSDSLTTTWGCRQGGQRWLAA